jgi:hypothetical protein
VAVLDQLAGEQVFHCHRTRSGHRVGGHDLPDGQFAELAAEVACRFSAVAAPTRNQPMSANHSPPKPCPVKKVSRPSATSAQPKT